MAEYFNPDKTIAGALELCEALAIAVYNVPISNLNADQSLKKRDFLDAQLGTIVRELQAFTHPIPNVIAIAQRNATPEQKSLLGTYRAAITDYHNHQHIAQRFAAAAGEANREKHEIVADVNMIHHHIAQMRKSLQIILNVESGFQTAAARAA